MLGLVTIGQAPRDDVMRSMFAGSHGAAVLQSGALDELADSEILDLMPRDDEHLLVTRLTDGSEVVVGKERLIDHLQRAIERLEARGATAVCILCTGEFPTLRARVPLVLPDRILSSVVDAAVPDGVLGILMPHSDQEGMMRRKWARDGRRIVTESVSPYTASSEVACVSRSLAATGARLIVMDCMGFDREMQEAARRAVDVPVVLANGLVGAVLGELFTLSPCRSDHPE